MIRKLLLLAVIVFPGPLKRFVYRRCLGWQIGRRVRIGLSYLDAREVRLGDDVRIGHLNVMLAAVEFEMGDRSHLGNLNFISSGRHTGPGWAHRLAIGSDVYVTSRHFIDLGGTVMIGDRTTVAGRETHFWSHTLDVSGDKPVLVPGELHVGTDCYIGARSTLLFCRIPDRAAVGAGSVVTKSFPPEKDRLLIAGNPAIVRKRYSQPDAGIACGQP
jgi:acetyltransferase-like isoleucine patch superfamily enzyme